MRKLIQRGASRLADNNPFIQQLKVAKKDAEAKLEQETDKFIVPINWVDFARKVKIRSGGDIKPFNPYPYQEELVDLMLNRSIIVAKSRQLGISETVTCFMLWRACLNPGYLGLVFSKTQTDSSLLARRMKRMIASLGLKTATENLSDIEIQGYGRILFRNSKPDSARGIESVVDTFFDEFAFLDTAKEVYDALAPAQQMVGDKARVFIISTPNGKSGFYWDLLSNGNDGKDIELICNKVSQGEDKPFQHWIDSGGWGKIIIHWKAHPKYGSNPNFLQEVHEKQKLSWSTIDQEYNLSFQESAVNIFSADLVRAGAVGEFEPKREFDADYYLGVDPATTGADYCVGIVLKKKADKYSVVALYRKRQQTSEYNIYQLGELIRKYQPSSVLIETNGGVGSIFIEKLSKEYQDYKFEGFHTNQESKATVIASLLLVLEQQKLNYPEACPITEELLNFRKKGKQMEAGQGHDDTVLALAFAVLLAERDNKWNFSNVNRFKSIQE